MNEWRGQVELFNKCKLISESEGTVAGALRRSSSDYLLQSLPFKTSATEVMKSVTKLTAFQYWYQSWVQKSPTTSWDVCIHKSKILSLSKYDWIWVIRKYVFICFLKCPRIYMPVWMCDSNICQYLTMTIIWSDVHNHSCLVLELNCPHLVYWNTHKPVWS